MAVKKRVLSGMRPTGRLHLGHLLGALNNWVKLQEQYDCFYMVADWHALMSEYEDTKLLRENSIEMTRDFIAAGLDPEKSVIFIQSHVPEHLELAMVFSDITPLGWVERCPTYKEQLREVKGRDLTTYGFLGYPVLQAADIALYKASAVPVGIDQLPHLELTREIIRRFNTLYGGRLFPEPDPLLTRVPKLLGLDNRKMSKSYGNFIALSDTPEEIAKKVAGMITDPKRIKLSDRGHPDICNVFSYYSIFSDQAALDKIRQSCEGAKTGCTECKKALAVALAEYLEPMRKKAAALSDDDIRDILRSGDKSARAAALETMAAVRDVVNFA
ncbi:MAG: tryptophan--tRNA ligase [Candidatus Omnitrophica bacterium]|nr:tryptophan--tRNA ligase [Candidatus Omnitrophota bacterium]